jgi:catechol 2,3-dioxygenase
MTTTGKPQHHPNLKFSHFGFAVHDLVVMEEFYTRVLDFTVTDRGMVEGMELIFLSRDPEDHHQIILASGKPEGIPPNPFIPQFGSVINQISFRVSSLAELRKIHAIFQSENVQSIFPANHGIAWSIYAHDPEGNNLEFFVDTDWYFPQPFLVPLDFSRSDEEIRAETAKFSQEQEGFEPYCELRKRFANKMNVYRAQA